MGSLIDPLEPEIDFVVRVRRSGIFLGFHMFEDSADERFPLPFLHA